MADIDEDDENEGAEGKDKGSKKKLIIMIVAGLVFLGAGTGGTLYFTGMLGGGDKAEQPEEEHGGKADKKKAKTKVKKRGGTPIYFKFESPFTVNFETQSGLRFLQIDIEMMSYDSDAVEAVKTHLPVIKNNIILMLSSQTYGLLISREGKEELRKHTLEEIRKVLKENYGEPGVEEVYFTSFVMQ